MHVKRMLNERYGSFDTQTMFWVLDTSEELRDGMLVFMEKRPPAMDPSGHRPPRQLGPLPRPSRSWARGVCGSIAT